MENSNYPHPDAPPPGGPYPPDRTWGIVIIVLSALGICLGGCVALGGGALGAIGAGVAATAPRNGGEAAATAGAGGLIMMVGILIALLSAARLYAGMLIMNSKRLGFMIAGITSAISFVVTFYRFNPGSLVPLAISGVIVYYCWARMNGNMGPPALD